MKYQSLDSTQERRRFSKTCIFFTVFCAVVACVCVLFLLGVFNGNNYSKPTIQSLNGKNWIVSGFNLSKVPATVPGQIHTDLLKAGIITEPFYGWNVDTLRWIPYSDWTYESAFTVGSSLLKHSVVQMVALGLDTIADIFLNDKYLFSGDNMFRTYKIDAKPFLKSGTNKIKVVFTSKVAAANTTAHKCTPEKYGWCPVNHNPSFQDGFEYVNYLRTEPCSFSWDWGPAFAPVGIWRDLYLLAFDSAVIQDVTAVAEPFNASVEVQQKRKSGEIPGFDDPSFHLSPDDNSEQAQIARGFARTDWQFDLSEWSLDVNAIIDAGTFVYSSTFISGKVTACVEVGKHSFCNSSLKALQVGQETVVPIHIRHITGVNPWFPNDFGDQQLYKLKVTFKYNDYEDKWEKKIGFRTVELVQNDIPGGRSFFFRVNGVPIPVHGSNWIPTDAFESRVTRDSLLPFFRALKEGHQNMIRNWGGGIYQRDEFYDLADEHGILIWEDMMWACNDYAVSELYLQSSAQEVIDNVRRIQHHPSIAIWAGNNENEGRYNPKSKGVSFYSDLYFRTIQSNLTTVDTSIPFVGSSPSNGNETADAPVCYNSQSEYFGDQHLYLYLAATIYERIWIAKLAIIHDNENCASTRAVVLEQPNDAQSQSSWWNRWFQIYIMIMQRYIFPNSTNPNNFNHTLWMSQVYQSYCYKTEVEHLRRLRNTCTTKTPGCNLGQMYWQTNDIWPGASWSSIDYYGRYKMVQYYANRFYSPILVSAFIDYYNNDTVHYSLINDDVRNGANGTVKFTLFSWEKGEVGSWVESFVVQPASVAEIGSMPLLDILAHAHGNCPQAADCVLSFTAYNSSQPSNQTAISNNFLFLDSLNKVTTMQDPKIIIKSVTQEPGYFKVVIQCNSVAAFVWLETEFKGHFSDNGMFLPGKPGAAFSLMFFSDDSSLSRQQLQDSLSVWSIFDTANYSSGINTSL